MEKATTIPTVHLSSAACHHRMPVVGMGMAADPFDATALKLSVLEAIKLGYRHFDTATVYGSEKLLGEAIAEALQLGLIGSREELFITSKVWSSDGYHDLVVPALKKSLQTLQLEYLDLYLIHMPISAKPGKWTMQIDKEDLAPMDFKSVWAAMEECQKLGLTKSIGVSNFSCKKLQNILSSATIPPSVNQVEMNPVWQQKKLIDFCKANNIIVTAFSPLGAQGTGWASNNVMDSEVLKDIAKAKGKTVAQVALKWIIEQGATLVVKTVKKERMKQNIDIFDWAFSEDDLNKIKQIPQQRGMLKEELLSANGPYKSLDEFWDGEY